MFIGNKMKKIQQDLLYYVFLLIILVVTNIYFFAPHYNDFPGLAAICNVMHDNILYCLNINWGFMVPLMAYLFTLVTDNLLLSQRIMSGLACFLLLFTMLYIMNKEGYRQKHKSLILIFFAISPWFFDTILSMHFDAIPLSIILLFTYISLKKPGNYLLYGFLIGLSFWFRFHFMIYSLLFPLIILINTRKIKPFIEAGLGVIISLSIPHILTYIAYNQLSLGNQKFIIAQFFGIADWGYEFSQKIEKMSIGDIFQQANVIGSVVRKSISFIESILFFIIIASFVNFKKIIKEKKMMAFFAVSLFILFFVFIRGFTYRLTLGLAVPLLLLIPDMDVKSLNRKILLITVVILYLFIPEAKLIRDYYNKIQEHQYIYKKVSQTIDLDKSSGNRILALGEMYNFSDRNLEFSNTILDGWIVRFKPVMDRYDLIDIHNIYRKDVMEKIRQYDYVIQKKTDYNYKPLKLSDTHKLLHSDQVINIFTRKSQGS